MSSYGTSAYGTSIYGPAPYGSSSGFVPVADWRLAVDWDTDDCYYIKVDGCDIGGVDKLFKTTANTKRIIWNSTAIDIGDTPWSLVNDMTRVEGLPHLKRTSSAADPATLSANQLQLVSTLTTRIIKKVIAKSGLADSPTANDVFTITTTNESGSNDGESYECNVRALVTHQSSATAGANGSAAKKYRGSFTHTMINDGTPVTTAVEDNFTGTSAATNSGSRDINTIVMSVANTSNYVRTVQFTIDVTGAQAATAEIVCEVELIWRGFNTPPVIAVA